MVTKRELSERIARATTVSRREAEVVVEMFLAELAQELRGGGVVQLREFGTFRAMESPGRSVRHPVSGEELEIGAQWRVRFKASPALNRVVNEVEE